MDIIKTVPDKLEQMKERMFIFFLFLTSFIFRLPTLFNDFYDVDELAAIVQTKEFLAGFKAGTDFTESKLPLYHLIFKLSYTLNAAYGWVIVHAVTILIVFLTAVSVYYTGKLIKDRRTGIIASVMYAVLISSFNRHFMAVNGEVVYNLPIAAGLLFFILAAGNRPVHQRILYFMLAVISSIAAMMVKFHGVILPAFIAFVIIFYIPYYRKNLRKLLIPYTAVSAVILSVTVFDFFITKKFAPQITGRALELLFYATSDRSGNPFFLIGIYSYRQLTIALWHAVLWVPAAVYMYRFIRNRFRRETYEESAVALFALITFLMVFAGGARVYYHYFMTSYPALCLAAAIALVSFDTPAVKKMYTRFTAALLIPGLFFFSWNVKDLYIKYFSQELFYNEPAPLFWFRAVAVSSMDDYLLPNGIYKKTAEYIKKNTRPDETIFVWGDGPHLYYFSDRRIAVKHVWPKGTAIKIEKLYKQKNPGSVKEAELQQQEIIDRIELKKPALFIDTSPKGMHRSVTGLGSFAKFPYEVPALIRKYLNEHYTFETAVDDYKIYRRVK